MWVLFVLKPSLLSDQIIYSRLVMFILCLSSRTSHFSKGTCCFYWRMAWETKIWPPDVFPVTRVLLLLIPISYLNKSIYVFTNVYGLCRGTMVKNLPVQEVQELWVWSLCQGDPLEKEIATCSILLPWKISWTQEPGRLRRVGHDWAHTHTNVYTYICTFFYMCMCTKSLQSCPTLCNPMGSSLPGSSVHGIL